MHILFKATAKRKSKFSSDIKEGKKEIKFKVWYFVTKIVLTYCESSDREKLLKVEAKGREFENFLRSLEQFIQTVKGRDNFW